MYAILSLCGGDPVCRKTLLTEVLPSLSSCGIARLAVRAGSDS
jgi:hypothetical protein